MTRHHHQVMWQLQITIRGRISTAWHIDSTLYAGSCPDTAILRSLGRARDYLRSAVLAGLRVKMLDARAVPVRPLTLADLRK